MFRRKLHGAVGSIREIVFGLEDSLVSTLGAVTGIAAGTDSSYIVMLSGLVLIAVESVSMAAGSYLSSEAAGEAERRNEHPLRAAVVMFIAYVVGGMFPLVPYLVFPVYQAYLPSIVVTILALFLLGVWKGKITGRSRLLSGLQMTTVSVAAAFLGYLIGRLVANFAGVSV